MTRPLPDVPAHPSTIGGLLTRSARRHPSRTALTFAGRSWSYAELDTAVGRVAAGLLGAGLRPGDRVAVFGRNSDAYLLLFLGCARAGLVHVPVNHGARGAELRHLLTQSSPAAIFTDPELSPEVDALPDPPGAVLRGSILGGDGAPDVLAWAADGSAAVHEETGVDGGRLAQILYTSGTTSLPKGAMLTHRALLHEYVSSTLALDLTGDDVALHALPLYHSAQMHVFLVPSLAAGATNHLLSAPDLDEIAARVRQERVTSLFLPPTLWVAVLQRLRSGAGGLDTLGKAYYGASIMPTPVLEELRVLLPSTGFYNCFGQSEIGPLATVLRPEEHAERPASVGRSVMFVEARVVDRNMVDVPPGTAGEVVYRSPQLCSGYWDMPEETQEAFRGGWFHSGDLAVMDEHGYLTVVDRIKDVVNTGGVLVASREVEEVLYQHADVGEVAVVGVPHRYWIEAVVAAVVPARAAAGRFDARALTDFAAGHLPGHKRPKRVVVLDALPKNAAGKILKRELRDLLTDRLADGTDGFGGETRLG
ncbi:AMP-binding protein [Streptomyces sp. J2-1]|uniref:fatty acyl-CoA synthetase n=1 Tax=Streptomyces corallincola TaxID=2851888 RepID=UPI001C38BA38|nr:fatty acyl-CoA synthetase [Streptomyces corallincola]MBV2353680.1 AMP-binding protein [Streptomyces corallincola]